MIIFIMLVTITSIGLLGILIVVTYTCMTTKSLHTLCSSFFRRESTKIKYATDEDYAERVCNGMNWRKAEDGRDFDLEHNFHRMLEFDGEEVQLDNCCEHHQHQPHEHRDQQCSSTDSDDAQIEEHRDHCHHHACDCTDDEHQELDEFDGAVDVTCPVSYKGRDHDANILVMQVPHLSGMLV